MKRPERLLFLPTRRMVKPSPGMGCGSGAPFSVVAAGWLGGSVKAVSMRFLNAAPPPETAGAPEME